MKTIILTAFAVISCILQISCSKDDDNQSKITVTDVDGNVYHTVKIGTQIWMVENLKTTKYNDDTAIPLVTDNTEWGYLSTPAYCWYYNDEATTKNPYGAIYNWYTVNTDKLCPVGWHVPSDDEWTKLIENLGGEDVAGGKLKEAGLTHWNSPNESATNESGFTAVPSGERGGTGEFHGMGDWGSWWSATDYDTTRAWSSSMTFFEAKVNRYSIYAEIGMSVRCLKDN
jgi:uncharacterized protein (TIGR02145 family)